MYRYLLNRTFNDGDQGKLIIVGVINHDYSSNVEESMVDICIQIRQYPNNSRLNVKCSRIVFRSIGKDIHLNSSLDKYIII